MLSGAGHLEVQVVATVSTPEATQRPIARNRQGSLLSALWVFATLNYLYCDVITIMDPEIFNDLGQGQMRGWEISQGFLLGAAVLVEIPIAMTILARVLHGAARRWTNVVAGTFMTLVQLATLTAGTPTPYYAFFSVIEIATTAFIVWYAWSRLKQDE